MSKYQATFNTDGSGEFTITLADDCSEHDFAALLPVADSIRAFLAPTIAAPLPTRAAALAALRKSSTVS